MRKILLLLLAVLVFQSCDRSGNPTATTESDEVVTLAPRVVRTTALPKPLYDGTDRVRVTVTSSNSTYSFAQTVSFSDRGVFVSGVPRTANVTIRLEGLDASGTVIWSGSSAEMLASWASANAFDILTSAAPSQTAYIGTTTWLWQEVTSSGASVEWLNLRDDGTWDRMYVKWVERGSISTRDTFFGRWDSGTYHQAGDSLHFLVDQESSCDYRGTLNNECGTDGPNWIEGSPRSFSWDWSKSAAGPLVLDGYSYDASSVIHENEHPPSRAPSNWEYDQVISGTNLTYHGELELRTDGTYTQKDTYTSTLGLISGATQTGKWFGNADSMRIEPTSQTECINSGSYLDCLDDSSFPSVTPDDPSIFLWDVPDTTLDLYNTTGDTLMWRWYPK